MRPSRGLHVPRRPSASRHDALCDSLVIRARRIDNAISQTILRVRHGSGRHAIAISIAISISESMDVLLDESQFCVGSPKNAST